MASVPHPCTRRKDGAPPSSLPQALQRWYSHMDASRKRRKKEKKRGPPARAILRPEAILSLTSYLNPFWWVPKVFSDDWLSTRLAAILFFFSETSPLDSPPGNYDQTIYAYACAHIRRLRYCLDLPPRYEPRKAQMM